VYCIQKKQHQKKFFFDAVYNVFLSI